MERTRKIRFVHIWCKLEICNHKAIKDLIKVMLNPLVDIAYS